MKHEFDIRSAGLALLAVGFFLLVSGCATPATSQGMVPEDFHIQAKYPYSVSVSVTGGQATSAVGKSQISSEMFTQALVDAINKSQVFSRVIQGKGGDYELSVVIVNVEQPTFGLSFTVKMEAGWMLRRADTGAVVWQESILSSHTATTSDAFAAVKRLRLATEGAAKENIRLGLDKISRLKL